MNASRVDTPVLLLAFFSLTGCHAYGQKPRDAAREVTVTTVQAKDATVTYQYVCRINSRRHIEVRAPVKGRLAAISVKDGQEVKRGDLLFQVGPLADGGTSDAGNHDKVVTVRAPFDGVIGRLLHEQDSPVPKGEPLTTLSDSSEMRAYFNVPEVRYLEYMADQKQNQQHPDVELLLANHSKYPQTGKLGAIGAVFNKETGNIAFRADFPNPDGRLRHGQTGTVLINRVLKDAVVIPRRAAFANLDRRFVYLVDRSNVAHLREVVVQNELDDLFVVKKGVGVGDKIVLEGVEQVRDGEKLK